MQVTKFKSLFVRCWISVDEDAQYLKGTFIFLNFEIPIMVYWKALSESLDFRAAILFTLIEYLV